MAKAINSDRFEIERRLGQDGTVSLAGVDEAGRGPLAGPVVAAAAVLPSTWVKAGMPVDLEALNDSKKFSARQRDRFFELLSGHTEIRYGIAVVEPRVIDQVNILQATHQAMNMALNQLSPQPDHALVDGRPVPGLSKPQTAIVKGDSKSYSIAAASILAKVTRDRLMLEFDREWPDYGFAEHKGYGTTRHMAALEKFGPCPIHRLSFAPLKPQAQGELF
jgi:ribonuclease HII